MSIWEIILTVGVPLAAVIWGVNICHQRGTWFLAGWNTMREEKKGSPGRRGDVPSVRKMCRRLRRRPVSFAVGQLLLL